MQVGRALCSRQSTRCAPSDCSRGTWMKRVAASATWGCRLSPTGLQPLTNRVAGSTPRGCGTRTSAPKAPRRSEPWRPRCAHTRMRSSTPPARDTQGCSLGTQGCRQAHLGLQAGMHRVAASTPTCSRSRHASVQRTQCIAASPPAAASPASSSARCLEA